MRVARKGPVVTVTLDSPHNANALSSTLLSALRSALDTAASDPAVRAVVLTGTGRTFSSGADLAERRTGVSISAALSAVFTTMVAMEKPVVARVNGHVRGGGMGLVGACDLAVAPEGATFAFSEVRVGVAPAIVAAPVLRRMHLRAFERYALTGELFGAREAQFSGLISTTVPSVAELDGWVARVVESVLLGEPGALAETKRITRLAQGTDEGVLASLPVLAALSDRLFSTEAAAEGMAAFLEKRAARWTSQATEWRREAP